MSSEIVLGSALQIPLFHGLAEHQMSEIVRRSDRVTYQAGEKLTYDGERGEAAILVFSGQATQFNPLSKTHPYRTITPGTLVGEMAMLVDAIHHLTVVADAPIKALKFRRSMIESLMAEDPALADHFVSRIAERLKKVAEEMRAALASAEDKPAFSAPSTALDRLDLDPLSSAENAPLQHPPTGVSHAPPSSSLNS